MRAFARSTAGTALAALAIGLVLATLAPQVAESQAPRRQVAAKKKPAPKPPAIAKPKAPPPREPVAIFSA